MSYRGNFTREKISGVSTLFHIIELSDSIDVSALSTHSTPSVILYDKMYGKGGSGILSTSYFTPSPFSSQK